MHRWPAGTSRRTCPPSSPGWPRATMPPARRGPQRRRRPNPRPPPPLLRPLVQPPCPEGVAAGAACAPETPGQLTAADEFLKTTLAQITATPGFRERGLVVVTFTSVGLAAQQGLPAATSTATLTSQ